MTKDFDGTSTPDPIWSAVSALDSTLGKSGIGSEFSSAKGLREQVGAQLAMATMEPLGASYSAAIAASSASIMEALKPSLAMQSVMKFIYPFKDMQAQLFPTSSFSDDLRARIAELNQVGRIAKELTSVQALISSAALSNAKAIHEQVGLMEVANSPSMMAAKLAAVATANSFTSSLKMAELLSMGTSLAQVGLSDVENIKWDAPASTELLSAIAAAAETLKEAPEPTPDLVNLPDASNDDDGGPVSSPQQLQSELAEAATTGDLSRLSPAAKAYFKWFLWLLGAIVSLIAAQNAVREELCFLQPKIWPGMTAGQMGKTVRKAMCEASLVFNGDYRFVKGTDVRLRESPGTKAAILPVQLADGQIVEVLDSSNPDWLYVTVIAENVEGWVSRKYTRVLSVN